MNSRQKKTRSPEEIQQQREVDMRLMQRVAAKDFDSFQELSTKYNALIFSTAYKVLNHYEDTEDVTTEVLNTIWKKADTYHAGKGSLITWICTTARNRAIDRVRSVQRRSALYDRYEQRAEMELPPLDLTGCEALYLSDARELLENAVSALSEDQQEVIRLAYFEGLTQKQISERISRPLGTVKARIRRGIDRLRIIFNERVKSEGQLVLSSVSN